MKPVILSIVLSLVSAPGALAQMTTPGILAGAGVTVAGANSLETSSSTLAALVEELDRNNPEIKAARREIDMRVARIAPAGAPPDPSLSFGYMGGLLRPPFFPSSANTSGFREFGLSQEMPYPGKLRLQTRVAATDADTARWSSENVRAAASSA